MKDLRSPYRTAPGSEPPELAGRDGEMGAARYAIEMAAEREPPNPIVFVGLRGVGKTAILRHVAREAQRAGALAIVAEADRELRFADVVRDELADELKKSQRLPKRLASAVAKLIEHLPKVSYKLPNAAGSVAVEGSGDVDDADGASDELETELLRLNEQLHEHGRFLMIGVDEIQEGSRRDLLRVIRVVHKTAGSNTPVLFFGAGLPNSPMILKNVRTYTERWAKFTLGLLGRRETFDAVVRPARHVGVVWAPDALERLYEVSSGYPYFVQQYAAAAWTHARTKTIQRSVVDEIVPGIQTSLDNSLYKPLFDQLTPRELRFALALESLGEGAHRLDDVADRLDVPSSAELSSIRTQLAKKDVVFFPNRGMVEFRMPLTHEYIARHQELSARLGR